MPNPLLAVWVFPVALLVTGTSFWVPPLFRKSPIKSGKLRAVAVTSARPSALYPELPAVAATVPGYESGGATAMFAPPRTAAVIITRLNREVVRLLELVNSSAGSLAA